jgi:hypothetical protein
MANDIGLREITLPTPSTSFSTRMASFSPLSLSGGRSICVTSPVITISSRSRAGQKHLHLLPRGVLRLVQEMKVVQGPAAHIPAGDLDVAPLEVFVIGVVPSISNRASYSGRR